MRVRSLRGAAAPIVALLLALAPVGAADRATIGVFRDWAAFREGSAAMPERCFAIAEPPAGTTAAGHGAFASVAAWPAQRVRTEFSVHLSHSSDGKAPVMLTIGTINVHLLVRDRDGWAPNRHADALIVSAMRSGSSMSISGVGERGIAFADAYRLRGAASAIDAASLACPLSR